MTASGRPPNGHWSTWISGPERRCARSMSTPSSSAHAPTAGSRTCGPRQTSCGIGTSTASLRMLVVPGSMRVKLQAEAEGLDAVFTAAGAEWRSAGCSMCLGMNPDQLAPGERSASTSNRNFEGRQGKGGRTHLVSPLVAAATAVRGTLSSPADLEPVVGLTAARPQPAPNPPTALTASPSRSHRHGSLHHPHRGRDPAAPQQRRHRPDHPGGVPQADQPDRIRGWVVRRVALRSDVRPQQSRLRRRFGARRRPRLRHRILP